MSGYTVSMTAEIPDVPTRSDPGDPHWKPIQHYLGITAFGINLFTADDPGTELAASHDEAESGQEEIYIVLAGRARVAVGDARFEAAAGTVVAITDPGLPRSIASLETATSVLVVGCRPGCFESSWQPRHFDGLARHPWLSG
jgi:hypothetical protein